MSGIDSPLDEMLDWVFGTGDALKLTAASVTQLNYWGTTGIHSPTPHWSGGCGSRRLWTFMDLVTLDLIARLGETCGVDPSLFRGADFGLNLSVAQAMSGWDLAVLVHQGGIEITPAFDLTRRTKDAGAPLVTVALVEPLATQLATHARSSRAEPTIR